MTVFGRGYGEEHIPDLVSIAEAVVIHEGRAVIHDPQTALIGRNFDVLYSGTNEPLMSLRPLLAAPLRFSLSYQPMPPKVGSSASDESPAHQHGTLQVESFVMTASQFEASRAFFVASEQRPFHGQTGYVARAWNEAGPFIASWRYPDNTVVRVVSLGADDSQRLVTETA